MLCAASSRSATALTGNMPQFSTIVALDLAIAERTWRRASGRASEPARLLKLFTVLKFLFCRLVVSSTVQSTARRVPRVPFSVATRRSVSLIVITSILCISVSNFIYCRSGRRRATFSNEYCRFGESSKLCCLYQRLWAFEKYPLTRFVITQSKHKYLYEY